MRKKYLSRLIPLFLVLILFSFQSSEVSAQEKMHLITGGGLHPATASISDGGDWWDSITSWFESISEDFQETGTKIKKKFESIKNSIAELFGAVDDGVHTFATEAGSEDEKANEINQSIDQVTGDLKNLNGDDPNNKKPNRSEIEKALIEDTSNRAREIFESGVSKKEMGPCLSGIHDPLTGKTYFGQNFKNNATMRQEYIKWLDNDADPIIKELVKEYESKIESGEIKLSEVADNRLAAHSEIRALDQVFKERRKAGLPVGRSTISELFLHNIDLYKSDRNGNLVTKIRCEHCRYLTDGINNVGHN
ncbi:hypothetical protein [Cytobacillus massiliigabonensis]|uniref:hypothetical protein n=1 Tax=Cytobacillus massiliigabonensis TaxID=1871011 RepID=UPI000C82044F|nr:hypothetical protein [Cytobacillus massiliigabonensis]